MFYISTVGCTFLYSLLIIHWFLKKKILNKTNSNAIASIAGWSCFWETFFNRYLPSLWSILEKTRAARYIFLHGNLSLKLKLSQRHPDFFQFDIHFLKAVVLPARRRRKKNLRSNSGCRIQNQFDIHLLKAYCFFSPPQAKTIWGSNSGCVMQSQFDPFFESVLRFQPTAGGKNFEVLMVVVVCGPSLTSIFWKRRLPLCLPRQRIFFCKTSTRRHLRHARRLRRLTFLQRFSRCHSKSAQRHFR